MKKADSLNNKKIVVLYHAECRDGFGAAFAAWKKFGARAAYLPVFYQQAPPAGLKNKEIYIVDFSYPAAILKKLVAANKKVVAIDHHVTAAANIKAASECVFDLQHSGAYLAWRYFHPETKVPLLIKYLEDQDLWKFKLPATRALTTYINTIKPDFKTFEKLRRALERPEKRRAFAAQGKILLEFRTELVKWLVANRAEEVIFEGRTVLAVNNSYKPLTSELGHALYEKKPPLAIIWHEFQGVRRVSLRSNGQIDVSGIAQKYGGGGHPAAAGFDLPANRPLPWKLTTKK